jgi:hypothetical protein
MAAIECDMPVIGADRSHKKAQNSKIRCKHAIGSGIVPEALPQEADQVRRRTCGNCRQHPSFHRENHAILFHGLFDKCTSTCCRMLIIIDMQFHNREPMAGRRYSAIIDTVRIQRSDWGESQVWFAYECCSTLLSGFENETRPFFSALPIMHAF